MNLTSIILLLINVILIFIFQNTTDKTTRFIVSFILMFEIGYFIAQQERNNK